MWEESVSQQPPKIVAPFSIIFFANSQKTLHVISSLFPKAIFGFFPTSLCLAVLNLWTGNGSSTAHKFALKPKEYQSLGTCNFSKIDSSSLNFTGNLSSGHTISVYVVNYNILRIMSGMGGLLFEN